MRDEQFVMEFDLLLICITKTSGERRDQRKRNLRLRVSSSEECGWQAGLLDYKRDSSVGCCCLCPQLLSLPQYHSSKRVSIYLNMDDEVQTGAIIRDVFRSRKTCFIPSMSGAIRCETILLVRVNLFKKADPATGVLSGEGLAVETSCPRIVSECSLARDLTLVSRTHIRATPHEKSVSQEQTRSKTRTEFIFYLVNGKSDCSTYTVRQLPTDILLWPSGRRGPEFVSAMRHLFHVRSDINVLQCQNPSMTTLRDIWHDGVLEGGRDLDGSMEQRRNERAGETGDPRENPPTNGIVRQKSEVTRPGIEPGSPWWEASGLTARPPWPHMEPTYYDTRAEILLRSDRGANPRPSDYKTATLPSSYEGRAASRVFLEVDNPISPTHTFPTHLNSERPKLKET
ncbi:hypothetical protein PR048_017688 [Dryococelus australis]|uniref:5-formyltetrahydrofolate cyclo-ligase n=1 Tax=Dryococelus australis TaxID=614101 RepID=A0ABQ9HAA6_9NEOP|nr:hypothetical protein PR048_017688 [Dryococelus australis]